MLKILIADDHPLFRNGLINALHFINDTCQVDQASNGNEVLEYLKTNECELIIMDINMPECNGIKTTELVRNQYPWIKIVGVSMFDDPYHVTKMIEAGANGYSTKDITLEELRVMVATVINGGFYLSKEVSYLLTEEHKRLMSKTGRNVNQLLTEREIEILILLCGQLSSKEIADKLSLSIRTIQTHRENILLKTGAINTVGLVLYAIENRHILLSK